MQVNIEIKCDNAAFVSYPEAEVSRILRDLSTMVFDRGMDDRSLLDWNGNVVGKFSVEN